MISANYISTGREDAVYNDYLFTCEKFLDDTLNEFNTEYINYRATVETALLESSIMGIEADVDSMLIVEKSEKNIVQKFGDAIIAMGKKFIEFIETMIRKMKDSFFKFKSNEKKLAELIKKHPELGKEKIQDLCANGVLDLSDMKSLAELDDEFEKILKSARMAENPDALDTQWEKAKKKCLGSKYSEKGIASNVETAAKAGAAVIALALAIKTFGPKVAESNKNMADLKAKEQALNHKCTEILAQGDDSRDKFNSSGCHGKILAINRERIGLHMMAIGKQKTAISRIQDLYASTLDKLESTEKNETKWKNYAGNNEAVFKRDNSDNS